MRSMYRLWREQSGLVLTLLLLVMVQKETFALVRLCEKVDGGKSLRCLKQMAGSNGDQYGRIGIINKSQSCPNVRFIKQEWIYDCGQTSPGPNAMLQRVFPGEVLRYGDFQTEMVLDFIKLGSCGEMKLLECYCGREAVKCSDYIFAATYKRGEHQMLFETFEKSLKTQYELDAPDDC